MDARLAPEQETLRVASVQLVDRLGPKTVLDLADRDRTATLEATVEATGWREMRAAGENGEPWSTAVEPALVAEELGRGPADVAFVGPTLGAELGRILDVVPDVPVTVALTAELSELGASVAPDAAGATVAWGTGTQRRDRATEIVELDLGPAIDGVDLTRTTRPVAGPRRSLGFVAWEDLGRWRALGLALTSADLCGVMRGALDLGCRYAAERRQYGAAIGSFQAVQHLLADAHVEAEGSRSISRYAAWAVDALAPAEALGAAAAAKAYCSRAARSVCEAVIQVHGGIGNTWDCSAHVFLRRALVSRAILGGVEVNLERVLGSRRIGSTDGLR